MLYSVRGRFANNYTFSVNPVDADSPHAALARVVESDEIKHYGHPVVAVMVKALTGKNKKIKISDKPAAERKGGGRKPKTPAPAASTGPAAAQSGGARKR